MRNNTKEQQVKDYLILKIVDGHYGIGSVIPTEAELSEKLSVSRMTVRNALIFLSLNNWIYSRQGKGYYVADKGWSNVVSLSNYLGSPINEVKWEKTPEWVKNVLSEQPANKKISYTKKYLDEKGKLAAVSFGILSMEIASQIKLEDLSSGLVRWLRFHNVPIDYFSQDVLVTDLPNVPEYSKMVKQLGYVSTECLPIILTSIVRRDGELVEASVLLISKDKMRISKRVLF